MQQQSANAAQQMKHSTMQQQSATRNTANEATYSKRNSNTANATATPHSKMKQQQHNNSNTATTQQNEATAK
jgi:hypothetical protein